jgi:hypothetical protein
VYAASQVGWGLAFYLWTPFAISMVAALDRQGRWTVAAGAVSLLGVALGPWAAGAALEPWVDAGLAVLVGRCATSALALRLPVTLTLDRVSIPLGLFRDRDRV